MRTETDTGRSSGDAAEREIEGHRRELTGYCYRMLGSGFEAEDAVQETMVRAWRGADAFEGRSSVRSWLYRIATNVCIDMQRGPQRRARPMDLGPSVTADSVLPGRLPEEAWVQPIPDATVLPEGDPADVAATRDTIRLAFVAALQHLPARQRAVLILCEVLKWQATEVALLLDTTVASVNSALQRARATMAARELTEATRAPSFDAETEALLARYCAAFESYDVTSLVALLHEDATFSMPPHPMWLVGPADVAAWMLGTGIGCRGARLVATSANGCGAFGNYRLVRPGLWEPFNLQVIETSEGRISSIHNFLFPDLFDLFGLPARLTDEEDHR